MIKKIYLALYRKSSIPEERGEYSSGFWQNKIRKAVLKIVSAYQGRFLDVGCGAGLFLSQLKKAGPSLEIWGADTWQEMLGRAEERFKKEGITGIHLVKTDASSLPFENSFFDGIACINVFICMRSLEEVRRTIKEMARVCKDGGRAIVEFRNRDNFLLRLKYRWARHYDPTLEGHPLSTYTKKDIIGALSDHGFEVIRESVLGFPIKKWAPVIILEAKKHV